MISFDKPPEEQEWDIAIERQSVTAGHKGVSFLYAFCQDSEGRWAAADPIFDEMWQAMVRTVDQKAQDEKIRQMARYIYEKALMSFIYSALTLYAVNKEVNFVPYKHGYLPLRETSVTDNHWSVRGQSE